MTRRLATHGFVPGLVLIAAWLFAPATAVGGDPCYHGFVQGDRTSVATDRVEVLPCAFGPVNARIPVGGTVTFVNGPDWDHLITGANQAWGDRDELLRTNAKVSYTFDEAGVYPYACALHRGMSGAIIVGDGGEDVEAAPAAPVASTTAPPAQGDGTQAGLLAGVAIGAVLAGGMLLLVMGRRRAPVAIEPVAQPGPAEPAPR